MPGLTACAGVTPSTTKGLGTVSTRPEPAPRPAYIQDLSLRIEREPIVRAPKKNAALVAFWKVHRWIYKQSRGRIGATVGKVRFLLLTTVGRKSGRQRTVALTYLPHDDGFVVVGTYSGEDRHPGWWLNLQANPVATVQAGRRSVTVTAREIQGDEREALYQRFTDLDSGYSEYQTRTEREIPVVLLSSH